MSWAITNRHYSTGFHGRVDYWLRATQAALEISLVLPPEVRVPVSSQVTQRRLVNAVPRLTGTFIASAKLRLDRGSLVLKGSDFTVPGKYEVGVTVMKMYSWDGGYSIANLSAMSNLEVTIVAAKIAPNITAE